MVHRKSEYRLNYKWLPSNLCQEVRQVTAGFREERKKCHLSHYWGWDYPPGPDAGRCDCENDDDADRILPPPENRRKHEMLLDQWNRSNIVPRTVPEYYRPMSLPPSKMAPHENLRVEGNKFKESEVQTPSWNNPAGKSASASAQPQLEKTEPPAVPPSPIPPNVPVVSMAQPPPPASASAPLPEMYVPQSDLENFGGSLPISSRTKPPEELQQRFGRHNFNRNGPLPQSVPPPMTSYAVPEPIFQRVSSAELPKYKSSILQPAVLRPQSAYVSRMADKPTSILHQRPPFMSYGWANDNKNVGDMRTYNVKAKPKEVYQSALRAYKRKEADVRRSIVAEQQKHLLSRYDPTKCPRHMINPSSIWMTEYRSNFSRCAHG